MSINARVQTLLEQEHVSFRTHPHAYATAARRVAKATGVPGRDVAKVVVVRTARGRYLMAVLPASCGCGAEGRQHVNRGAPGHRLRNWHAGCASS